MAPAEKFRLLSGLIKCYDAQSIIISTSGGRKWPWLIYKC